VKFCWLCGAVRELLAVVGGVPHCAACWNAAGRPSSDSLGEVHDLEVQTREQMTARGSTDRHMVRNGRT
jgi:hypothetical protein